MTVKELFDTYEFIVCATPEEEHEFYVDAYGEGLAASSIIDDDFIEDIMDSNPETYTRQDASWPVSYTYNGFCFTNSDKEFDFSHSYFTLRDKTSTPPVVVDDLL